MENNLQAVDARAALAARVVAPAWYLVVVGVLVAQHVLVQGMVDDVWTLPSGVLLVVGCALAWLGWRRSMGITVGAWAGWRSLAALAAWSVSALVCVRLAAAAQTVTPVVVYAVIALAASVIVGMVYAAALRYDVRRGHGPVGP